MRKHRQSDVYIYSVGMHITLYIDCSLLDI